MIRPPLIRRKSWLTVLSELKSRGLADVCVVCCDCEDERVPFRAVA